MCAREGAIGVRCPGGQHNSTELRRHRREIHEGNRPVLGSSADGVYLPVSRHVSSVWSFPSSGASVSRPQVLAVSSSFLFCQGCILIGFPTDFLLYGGPQYVCGCCNALYWLHELTKGAHSGKCF